MKIAQAVRVGQWADDKVRKGQKSSVRQSLQAGYAMSAYFPPRLRYLRQGDARLVLLPQYVERSNASPAGCEERYEPAHVGLKPGRTGRGPTGERGAKRKRPRVIPRSNRGPSAARGFSPCESMEAMLSFQVVELARCFAPTKVRLKPG